MTAAAGTGSANHHLTKAQRILFATALDVYGVTEFHHGAAIRSDQDMARIARSMHIPTHAHPASDVAPEKRGPTDQDTTVWPAKPALARDADLAAYPLLLACPFAPEYVRSGTWTTVRRARGQRHHIMTIPPGPRP